MENTHYAQMDLTQGGDCWIVPLNEDECVKVSAVICWDGPDFEIIALDIEGYYMEAKTWAFAQIYGKRKARIDTLIEEMWSYHIRDLERVSESPKIETWPEPIETQAEPIETQAEPIETQAETYYDSLGTGRD